MTALAPLVRTGDAIVETAKARYTTKSYDASRRIPEADLQAVRDLLDEEFGLHEKGFRALVVVSLGYRAEDDFNAALPKSRLPETEVITEI